MGGVAGVAVALAGDDVERSCLCGCLVCNGAPKPNSSGLCVFWPFMMICGCCSLTAVGLSVGLVLGLLTQTKELIIWMTVGVTLGGALLFIVVTMLIVWNSGDWFDDNLPF
ncbi:hypothetical protein Pelo_1190 [Pelomyxa schiedti]|nr:hypothetical protein Pelo_1190 [Pelomyxa schiedti]